MLRRRSAFSTTFTNKQCVIALGKNPRAYKVVLTMPCSTRQPVLFGKSCNIKAGLAVTCWLPTLYPGKKYHQSAFATVVLNAAYIMVRLAKS